MLKEFKEFIARGNVIDLAVAVVIGAAFGKIIASLVEGVITADRITSRQGRLFKPLHRHFRSESRVAGGCTAERFAGHCLWQVSQ